MIGLSCTAGAVLALCGQVRGTLELSLIHI